MCSHGKTLTEKSWTDTNCNKAGFAYYIGEDFVDDNNIAGITGLLNKKIRLKHKVIFLCYNIRMIYAHVNQGEGYLGIG